MFSRISDFFSDEIMDITKNKLNRVEGIDESIASDAILSGTRSIMESMKIALTKIDKDVLVAILRNSEVDFINNSLLNSIKENAYDILQFKEGFAPDLAKKVINNALPALINKISEKDADNSDFKIEYLLLTFSGEMNEQQVYNSLVSGLTSKLMSLLN